MKVRDALAEAVGAKHVMAGEEVDDRYRRDILGKYCAAPGFLVRPGSTEEVAAVVKIAGANGLSVTVIGGHTGTVGGAITATGSIALSLERMNRVIEIDPVSMSMTAEAGCILQTAQEAAEAEGAFLPLDLGSRGSATIGGTIAANAGGNRVLRWGMMREMVTGLEVVLADGSVVSSLTKMIKDNAGYSWKQLMIGSEGTLGIVTRAVLRLRPVPTTNQTALIALPSFLEATKLLRSLEVRLSGQLSSFELMWGDYYAAMTEAQLAERPRPLATGHAFYALVEKLGGDPDIDGDQFERVLMDAVEHGTIVDAVIAKSERERQALWAVREGLVPDALKPFMVYDVAMGLVDIPAFEAAARKAVMGAFAHATMLFYGHAGDGNLHIIVHLGPDGKTHEDAIDGLIFAAVRAVGGSIAGEHGIGLARRAYLGMSRSESELALMARLKTALDPQHVLNPGKVLAGG